MKKKQNIVKRGLPLNKETLCVLNTPQLKDVAGGSATGSHTSCGYPISCKEN